jgi:hypothetical protein
MYGVRASHKERESRTITLKRSTAASVTNLVDESLFLDLNQSRRIIAAWIADYNATPHSSLGCKTPARAYLPSAV